MVCCNDDFEDPTASLAGDPSRMPRWLWRPIDETAAARLLQRLEAWKGTPYAPGERTRGAGVDCREFLAAIMDEMHRREVPLELHKVPFDSGVNHVGAAAVAVRQIIEAYDLEEVTEQGVIEPGDLIAHRPSRDSTAGLTDAHGSVAGVIPQTCYHAPMQRGTVTQASLAGMAAVVAVYRPTHKETWI